MSGLLPDREQRHLLQFHLLPRLTYVYRLALAAGLILAGVVAQLLLFPEGAGPAIVVGGILLLAGNSLLLLKGYDLSPPRTIRHGKWERTTLDRFREVLDHDRQVSRWDRAVVDISCTTGFLSLLAFVIAPTALLLFLLSDRWDAEELMMVIGVDAAVLLLPHWITGIRKKWRPSALPERVQALLFALDGLDGEEEGVCRIQPTFRMVGEGVEQVPADARIFLRFPDAPEDFLGLQFQVAVNNVQGTKYPYLYAVIVAKEEFGLLGHLDAVEAEAADLTVETSREDDVDVIVIRQTTTKKTGYHTNRRAVARIARAAWRSVNRVLPAPATR